MRDWLSRDRAFWGTAFGGTVTIFSAAALWAGKLGGVAFAWVVSAALAFIALSHVGRYRLRERELDGRAEHLRQVALDVVRRNARTLLPAPGAVDGIDDALRELARDRELLLAAGASREERTAVLAAVEERVFERIVEELGRRTSATRGFPAADGRELPRILVEAYDSLAGAEPVRAWLEQRGALARADVVPLLAAFDDLQRLRRAARETQALVRR